MPRESASWNEAEARVWLERSRTGGKGLTAFCREHGVSHQRLSYWRARLGEQGAARPRPPAVTAATPGGGQRFVEVCAPKEEGAAGFLEVVVRGGLGIRVPRSFDAAHLRAVIEAVRPC